MNNKHKDDFSENIHKKLISLNPFSNLALSKELEEHNIQVQLVTPLFVQTKMNNYSTSVMKGNILMPDVESYTKFAVFTLGKSSQTTGYWSHGLQVSNLDLLIIITSFRIRDDFFFYFAVWWNEAVS